MFTIDNVKSDEFVNGLHTLDNQLFALVDFDGDLVGTEVVDKNSDSYIGNAKDGSSISKNLVRCVVLLTLSFFMGIVMNGIRLAFIQSLRLIAVRWRWFGRNIVELGFGSRSRKKWFQRLLFVIGRSIIRFLLPTFYYSAFNYTRVVHYRDNAPAIYPHWAFISYKPELLSKIIYSSFPPENAEDDRLYMNEMLVTLLIVLFWCIVAILCFGHVGPLLYVLLSAYIAAIICAKSYADDFIKSLGAAFRSKMSTDIDQYNKMMVLYGAPKAYVMIRACSRNETFLQNALKSIERQSYCNTRVVVLEDVDEKKKDTLTEVRRIVREFQDYEKHPAIARNITYSSGDYGSPAAALLQIRELSINSAGKDDVFILLDDDDEFRRDDAVKNIVLNMCRGKANLCLVSFETKGDIKKDITNNGGRIHNDLVRSLEDMSKTDFVENMRYSSSIGWTKVYRYDQMTWYEGLLRKYSERFCELQKFEDFPDFINYLNPDVVCTGVSEPTHSYFKRDGRVTTTPELKDFEEFRAGFLVLLLEMVNGEQKLINGAWDKACDFVFFKICQIEDIYCKMRKENENLKEWPNEPLWFTSCFYDRIKDNNNLMAGLMRYMGVKGVTSIQRSDLQKFVSERMYKLSEKKVLSLKNAYVDLCGPYAVEKETSTPSWWKKSKLKLKEYCKEKWNRVISLCRDGRR
ncbi:MAG: hypothetical protein K2M97_07765 [Muribaculaceae bacterium]|nr:hypothetical protein [Muribaculaceae bacterium]